MAIEYINTGTIANDGTGDDLREAFIKINDNFEEIDLRVIETITVENSGSLGQGIYSGRTGTVDNFKRLVAGNNVTLASGDNTITINSADSLSQLVAISDSGTVTVQDGQTITVSGGESISTRVNGQQIIIDLNSTNVVERDTAPTLGANLDASNNNITNVNILQANTVQGQGGIAANLEGLVYGFDVREFGPYLSGFDFGTIRNTYDNALEFILANVDLDFGTITPDTGDTVDLGFI